mgnify:CR=1 FL=1
MSKKTNGSGVNGSDNQGSKQPQEKIIRFPTSAEREKSRRNEKAKAEKQRGVESRIKSSYAPKVKINGNSANDVPFINLEKISPFVRFLIVAFLVVHLPVHLLLSAGEKNQAFFALGFVPGYFTGTFENAPWYAPIGIVSHIFIHGGWMHLIFNSVMAMAMGILFEREFGTRSAAIFFFACGIFGAAAYFALNPFSTAPVIGASGSVSGFFAAAIMIMAERGQMGKMGERGPWPILGFWLAFMLLTGFLSGEDMAWQAHVGGFVSGAGLYYLLRRGIIKF